MFVEEVQETALARALKHSAYGYIQISHGTLRSYDLFHAFRDALKRYAPRGYITKHRLGFFFVPKAAKYDDCHAFWQTEDASILVNQMQDALDDIAPDGYYFGNLQGDGSAFGWWPVEPEEERLAETVGEKLE